MPRPTSAARRWAEAAFDLAERDKKHDEWSKDLGVAAKVLGDERVSRIVDNPSLPLAEREGVIGKLLHGRVQPKVEHLVLLLGRRRRIELLPAISVEYDRRLRRSRGIETALVTSASPLSKDEIAAVKDRVTQITGATVELESAVDESLIGGLTVRIGDLLLDGSIRGRLERLREQLVAGAR